MRNLKSREVGEVGESGGSGESGEGGEVVIRIIDGFEKESG